MIDLSKYRIIDLSYELVPGERKIDGRYLHGEPFYGRLLLAGIAFLDALTGLHQITKQRVFLIALPVRMQRVTASWTRAIVLEEL